MTEYKVIHALSIDQLEKQVNERLADGWQLQGGVAFDSESSVFMQAMTNELRNQGAYVVHYSTGFKFVEKEP